MAKKSAPVDSGINQTDPEAERKERQDNPGQFACIDGAYIRLDEARQRRITFDGLNYEHTHEDDDGVWAYRQM